MRPSRALPVRCGHGATRCARYVLRYSRRVLCPCDAAMVLRGMYCDVPGACSTCAVWPWRYELREVCTAMRPSRALPVRCGHGATRCARYVLRYSRRVLCQCGVAMALRVARGMYCDVPGACSASAVRPWRYELCEICTAMRPSRALPVRCGHSATSCARYVLRYSRRVLCPCGAAMVLRGVRGMWCDASVACSASAMWPWRYEVRARYVL